MILLYLIAILVAIITGIILYARWNYGSLEATGIPVVPPKFILGSEPNLHSIVHHLEDVKRAKIYGDVYGFYEGRAPHVYVSDPEIAREILIKDFEYFRNRRALDFGHPLMNEMLDVLADEKWRTLRTGLTPQFTTGKIRLMSEKIKEAAFDCVEYIDKNCDESHVFDVKQLYSALTTDVIARCAFGTKLNSVNDPDNEFVKMNQKLTGDTHDPSWMFTWVATFPILAKGVPLFPPEAMDFFAVVLKRIMNSRRQNNVRENDFVDCFNDLLDKTKTEEYKRLGITELTITAQSELILFAGYETTATTLTMLSYHLARNPDKQEKLIEELDAAYEKHGKIDHDTLFELPYLNACIQEGLRMCPPLIRIERQCMKDWKHKDSNLVIKQGTTVMVPAWAVNYHEKYWPDPETFEPERFLPHNRDKINTNAFLSFGHGPRNCIGMRFAKEEINLVLARLLKDFKFESTPETKIKYKTGRTFLVQFQPVMLNIVRRNKDHNRL